MQKSLILLWYAVTGVFTTLSGQHNLMITPEKPQAGQTITITYTPGGNLAGDKVIEGLAYTTTPGSRIAQDLLLTRTGNKYTATLKTDTAANFIQFGFYSGSEFDNNFDEGYFIQLYQGEKLKPGSFLALAAFHQYFAEATGVQRSDEKALAAIEKEFELYPSQKANGYFQYFRLLRKNKPEEYQAALQKEIEAAIRNGLRREEDYSYLINLYSTGKLTAQADFFVTMRNDKFPGGKWAIDKVAENYMAEQDVTRKEALLAEIARNVNSKPEWKYLSANLPVFKSRLLGLYAANGMWDKYRKESAALDPAQRAMSYNSVAWDLQEKNEKLDLADEFATFATTYAKREMTKPTAPKPDYVTMKQWPEQRRNTYAMYADTWAMVKYRKGDYKKGFEVAKEVAMDILGGKDAEINNTYILLAEKVLPAKQLRPQLEKMFREGKGSAVATEALKKIYITEKKSEAGFEQYVGSLEQVIIQKKQEEVKNAIFSEPAPAFTLTDADGKKVNLADLKGKVVVLDFWATWCGPCISSFPAMQKVVDQYKDNADVRIIFVNTWERGNDKTRKAMDFLRQKEFRFDVLFDLDNAVAEQFRVEGIPSKFVIDKAGNIRFRSIGYMGSDTELIAEVATMIETLNKN